MRHVEGANDLLLVGRPLLRGVGGDDDGGRTDHLVERGVGGHHLIERLREGDPGQPHRRGAVLELLVVVDGDAGGGAQGVEDVAQAGVGELERQRFVRRRVQDRRCRGAARLLPQRLHARDGARRLELLAQDALQFGDGHRHLLVRRIEGVGAPVGGEGGRKLLVGFEGPGISGMHQRGLPHRAFEGDAVLRPIRVSVQRAPVVLDGGVPLVGSGGLFASAECAPGRTAGQQRRRDQHRDQGDPGATRPPSDQPCHSEPTHCDLSAPPALRGMRVSRYGATAPYGTDSRSRRAVRARPPPPAATRCRPLPHRGCHRRYAHACTTGPPPGARRPRHARPNPGHAPPHHRCPSGAASGSGPSHSPSAPTRSARRRSRSRVPSAPSARLANPT